MKNIYLQRLMTYFNTMLHYLNNNKKGVYMRYIKKVMILLSLFLIFNQTNNVSSQTIDPESDTAPLVQNRLVVFESEM